MSGKPILLILPILVMLGIAGVLDSRRNSGDIFRIPITGYDPRDLLSGHYLQYSVLIGRNLNCSGVNPGKQICVCYSKNLGLVHPEWAGECSTRPSDCSRFISGHCGGGTFKAGIERYYIPEQFQSVLEYVPRGTSLEVSVDSNGVPIVRQLYVGDLTVEDYALSQVR